MEKDSIRYEQNRVLNAHPFFSDAFNALDKNDPFLCENKTSGASIVRDILAKFKAGMTLSTKQVACVEKIWSDIQVQAINDARSGPAPIGRDTKAGTILANKWKLTSYGWTNKMMVEFENGSTCWVSVPKRPFGEDVENGDLEDVKIILTATFKPSQDKRSFCFGSRPTVKIVNSLFVNGPVGVGKSEAIKKVVRRDEGDHQFL